MKHEYYKVESVKKVVTPNDVYCRGIRQPESVKKEIRDFLAVQNLKIVGFRPVEDNERGLNDGGYGVEPGTFWDKAHKQMNPRFIVQSIDPPPSNGLDLFWE